MNYRLREGLSCCDVDGTLIFLDLDKDRYFRLPDHMQHALHAHLLDGTGGTDVDALVQLNILARTDGASAHVGPPRHPPPSQSALESGPALAELDVLTLAEVIATVFSMRLQLRWRRLRRVIDSLQDYREREQSRLPSALAAPADHVLLRNTKAFCRARRHVPIEPSCLLDSLSLVRFLARRQIQARLVFGVTHQPFAAHCWVQSGCWVLNDTLGNVMAYTPILEA